MLDKHAHGADIWVPLRAIGATFLGDRGVDDPGFKVEGVILGSAIHATNATIFALILAMILAALLGGRVVSRPWLVALTLTGGVIYALSVMVVMQNVVVPLADPDFAEYSSGQGQFIVEHVLYGLSVSACLATAWRSQRTKPAATGERRLQRA